MFNIEWINELLGGIVISAVLACLLAVLLLVGRKAASQQSQWRHQLDKTTYERDHLNTQLQALEQQHGQLQSQAQSQQQNLNQLEVEHGRLQERLQEQQRHHHQHQQELLSRAEQLQQRLDAEQHGYQELSRQHVQLQTTLEQREKNHQQQIEQFNHSKQLLKQEFENLAHKIFEEKGKNFTASNQSHMDSLLKPFREQIDGFQKRVNEVHDAAMKGNIGLNAEIKKVLDIGLQMSKEANNLSTALKGGAQQRGAWGEAQLKRTLEMSGLIEDAHYSGQTSFKDREGKQKQTDYLIKLPDGKHIIIDSKVTLLAYDKAVCAESPEAQQLAMAEHIKAVKSHIDDLASKDYTNLINMRSPSFVLMFMPIEPAYIEALKHSKDLFSYGYEKNIVLVSHTTLIPILRTVANLWMMERSTAEAREISDKAGEIYNQVCVVAERLQKLGGTLNTVSNHYNSTVKALAGQQGLHGKVERFASLSTKVSKNLPQLEPNHLDFETERLSLLVAEPLPEEKEPETDTSALEDH